MSREHPRIIVLPDDVFDALVAKGWLVDDDDGEDPAEE